MHRDHELHYATVVSCGTKWDDGAVSRHTPSVPTGSENEGRRRRDRRLVTAVLTASRVLVSVAARSLETVRNAVTLTQFRTLVVLHSRRGTNLNGLAAEVGVTASTRCGWSTSW